MGSRNSPSYDNRSRSQISGMIPPSCERVVYWIILVESFFKPLC